MAHPASDTARRGPRAARAVARGRALGALARSSFVFGVLGLAMHAAHAQQAGMIAIPGNGEQQGGAITPEEYALAVARANGKTLPDAASMAPAAAVATAAPAPMRPMPVAAPRAPAEESESASDGTITIPGNGEPAAAVNSIAAAQRYVPQIQTIPAPAPAPAMQPAGGFQRVNVQVPNNRTVVPVTITEQPESAARAMPLPTTLPVRPANPVNPAAFSTANRRYVAPTAAVAAAAPAPRALAPASAAAPTGQQDGEAVRAVAQAFLEQQAAGLPGKVTITVAQVFPRGLAACASLEPFLPPAARMWGNTTVGVRCVGERPWTLYLQARVSMMVTYYVAARPMMPNEVLAAVDLMPREGDLANLPRTVITDPSQAIGAVALARVSAGLPLRTDMLRSASSVVIGQTVKLIAVGSDFSISAEGSVMNNAAPGQQVQVRTAGGQIITGVVKDAGTVEVQI